MKNKVLHTMNLSKELHALALAWTQSQNNFEDAIKSAQGNFPKVDDCPVEIRASLTALGVLQESLQTQFWGAVNEILPDEYSDNVQQCNPVKGTVRVLDEKRSDECECDESEGEDNNSAGSIDDMLNGIEGLESADDHVERLADDLRNKRGGQA